MNTTLLWFKDKKPKDWDNCWGGLPENFEAPRFYKGDRIWLLLSSPDGDKRGYLLQVKGVAVDISLDTQDRRTKVETQWVYVKRQID